MKKNMITLFKDNNLENKIVAALDLYQYFNVALIISSVTIFQLSKKKRNKELSFWISTVNIHCCFLIILIVNGELDFDLRERCGRQTAAKRKDEEDWRTPRGNQHYLLTDPFLFKVEVLFFYYLNFYLDILKVIGEAKFS